MQENTMRQHPWKIRFIVSLLLLILGFVGLVITDIQKDGGWFYWRLITPIYALLSLWMSWYLHPKDEFTFSEIWHEMLHWFGLILAIYLLSKFVSIGLVGRFEAGLMALSMLALTTFLAGIYIEVTFIFIGLLLGFFAYCVAFLNQYLYAIVLPIVVVAAGIIFWLVYHKKSIGHKSDSNQSKDN